jgi:serine/threonine protein kinase
VSLTLQVCQGLQAAHEAGVIHRDLKPANVMVEALPDGEERARILDFGLAKVVHGDHMVTGLTERDMIFGTPEYMAPEQARGDEVDVRCDVYACGVILYQLVTGTVPISGKTPLATMTAQLTEAVQSPRERAPDRAIPPAIEAVILRALQKDPEERYATARALAEALESVQERRVISVNPRSGSAADPVSDTDLHMENDPDGIAPPSARWARKSLAMVAPVGGQPAWVWIAITIATAALCIGAGVWLALRG